MGKVRHPKGKTCPRVKRDIESNICKESVESTFGQCHCFLGKAKTTTQMLWPVRISVDVGCVCVCECVRVCALDLTESLAALQVSQKQGLPRQVWVCFWFGVVFFKSLMVHRFVSRSPPKKQIEQKATVSFFPPIAPALVNGQP